MESIVYQADAFSDKPFCGNPAAVLFFDEFPADSVMQNIALEMNLSETAFLAGKSNRYNLRWFAPTVEIDLCGHATLASAHILYENGICNADETIFFNTKSGELRVENHSGWITLDFPADQPEFMENPKELETLLGARIKRAAKARLDIILELETETVLRKLTPDLFALSKHPYRCIIITARAQSDDFDFVSRVFAPSIGISEDPVTGAAHCSLGPYWAGKLNKTSLTAYQASRRGGMVKIETGPERVLLSGKAVTVMQGKIHW